MSQRQHTDKTFQQYTAEVAKRTKRNLAGSPSAATLAARLAMEQINHKAARALIRELEKGNALYRAIAQEAVASLESAGQANTAALAQIWIMLGDRLAEALAVQDKLIDEAMRAARARSASARNAANALHSKAGGSRDKAAQMRQHWASGKYSSRDICAEQECADLGMSFSAARRALRNTPEPERNT